MSDWFVVCDYVTYGAYEEPIGLVCPWTLTRIVRLPCGFRIKVQPEYVNGDRLARRSATTKSCGPARSEAP